MSKLGKHRKLRLWTIDEIEQAILSAPRRATHCIDAAEERRQREEFFRSLNEVEAVLTGRKVRPQVE